MGLDISWIKKRINHNKIEVAMVRLQEVIGGLLTVLLTFLFMDLRKMRSIRSDDQIEILKKEAADKEIMYKVFLTKTEHDDKCNITLSRIEKNILEMKIEILEEIKNNRKVSG